MCIRDSPKDGPSAGIAITTALLSALTDRPVRHDVAMTGEVTLRGRVMPIGGLREKTMGALRAGIRTVILPKENEKDLDEIDPNVRAKLRFVPVAVSYTHLDVYKRQLLQGVVDCFFEEDGALVVVDFKTDRIAPDALAERAEHYRPQLEAYSLALAQVIGKPVKEKILYFLRRGEQIIL